MNIGIMTKTRTGIAYLLCDELNARGVNASILNEDVCIGAHLRNYDAFIIKSSKPLFLHLGNYAKKLGIPVYPDPLMAWHIRDRILNEVVMAEAGLATPQIAYGSKEALLRTLPDDFFPAISKLVMSSNGRHIQRVNSKHDLKQLKTDFVYLQQVIIGKHYLINFVRDTTYMWTKDPFVVDKNGFTRIEPIPGAAELVGKFRARTNYLVGDLDVVLTPDGTFYTVDPGSFPSFKMLPGIEKELAMIFIDHFGASRHSAV